MLLPQSAQYALRAMATLANLKPGEVLAARDLAERTGVPVHYLSKIMRRLVVRGLVVARRGHGGGFALGKPARGITFAAILAAGDFGPLPDACAFGWGSCDPRNHCMLHETYSQVRRIYTDGRDHPSPADAYPLYYGDSIGFWDGPRLVIHTNQLMARSMGRNQPEQSEQMEPVEIWQKTAPGVITADVWLWDPALYTEPWYMQRRYTQVANPDHSLRMNYWHCGENPNNDVHKTSDGGTQYTDFTFTAGDDSAKEQSK